MASVRPPPDYETIRRQIHSEHGKLSKRLQEVAQFALEHPTDMAIATIATLSERAKVPPSALIRFAKAFGYSGFSAMQRAFQTRIVEHSASYKERVRNIHIDAADESGGVIKSLLGKFIHTNTCSLEELAQSCDYGLLEQALDSLEAAATVYIAGQRRSFPVAAYLAYALNHADKKALLLDGVGGMTREHAGHMRAQDLLIAITYPPYAQETQAVIDLAVRADTPVLLITDSALCPAAQQATLCLKIMDAEVHSFRSLTATLCVAQVLATALAFKNTNPLCQETEL